MATFNSNKNNHTHIYKHIPPLVHFNLLKKIYPKTVRNKF